MVATKNPEIRKAVDTLYELSTDATVRAEYERRMKAWRDYMSEHDGAFDRGIQKGVEKTARNALAAGASIEFVQKITGLGVETIKGLRAK